MPNKHEWPPDGDWTLECLVATHRPPCRKCLNCKEWIRPEQAGQPCKVFNQSNYAYPQLRGLEVKDA
jgi:hypothetical protein